MKTKMIHIRIDDTLHSKFEAALDQEGLTKTHVLIQAIHDFVKKTDSTNIQKS